MKINYSLSITKSKKYCIIQYVYQEQPDIKRKKKTTLLCKYFSRHSKSMILTIIMDEKQKGKE